MVVCAGAVMSAACATSARAQQLTATWLNPVSGNWTDPTQWSTPNFPNNGNPAGTTYHAVIDAVGGPYTVTLGESVALTSLTVDAADATLDLTSGTLTVNNDWSVSNGRLVLNGGTLGGLGALTVSDRLEWSGGHASGGAVMRIGSNGALAITSSSTKMLSRFLETQGTAHWSGGGDVALNVGAWLNSGDLQIDVQSGELQRLLPGAGGGWLANTGVITKTGEGTLQLGDSSLPGSFAFFNTGHLRVQSGVVDYHPANSSSTSGTLEIDRGAVMLFRSGTSLAGPTMISGSGDATFFGAFEHAGTVALGGVLRSTAESLEPVGQGHFLGAVAAGRVVIEGRPSLTTFWAPVAVTDGLQIASSTNIRAPLQLNGSYLEVLGRLGYYDVGAPLLVQSARVSGDLEGSGEVRFTGAVDWHGGRMAMARATFAESAIVETTPGPWVQVGGQLVVDCDLTLRTTLFLHGEFVNNGALSIDASQAALSVHGSGTLLNNGSLHVFGGDAKFGPEITVVGDGAFRISSGVVTVEDAMLDIPAIQLDRGAMLRFTDSGERREVISGGGVVEFIQGAQTLTSAASIEGLAIVRGNVLTVERGASVGTLRMSLGSMAVHSGALIGRLEITGGELTLPSEFTVPVGASFLWSGGNLSGAGNLRVLGAMDIVGLGTRTLSASLENSGTLTWSGEDLRINSQRQLLNAGEMLITPVAGAGQLMRGPGSFVNTGVLTINGDIGGAVSLDPGFVVQNSGQIHVASGKLVVDAGVMNSGVMGIDDGAILEINNVVGTQIGHVVGEGKLVIRGATHTVAPGGVEVTGTLGIVNGDVTLEHFPMRSLELGGSVTPLVDCVIADSFAWSGGTLRGPGEVRVAAGASSSLHTGAKALSGSLVNDGDMSWAGGALTLSGGTLVNNGQFAVSAQAAASGSGAGGTFVNNGVLVGMSGGTATIGSVGAFVFENNGEVVVSQGRLAFDRTLLNNATIDVHAGATLRLGGTLAQGVGAAITGAGAVEFANGVHDLEKGVISTTGPLRTLSGTVNVGSMLGAPSWQFSGGTTNFLMSESIGDAALLGGSIGGDGAVSMNSLNWAQGVMLAGGDVLVGGGPMSIGGATGARTLSRRLTSDGAASLTAGTLTLSGGVLRNLGDLSMSVGASILGDANGGRFENDGTTSIVGSGVATIGGLGMSMQNTGSINVGAGATLRLVANINSGDFGILTGAGALEIQDGVVHAQAGGLSVAGGVKVLGGDVHVESPSASPWSILGGSTAFVGGAAELTELRLDAGELTGDATVSTGSLFRWFGGSMSGSGRTVIGEGAQAVFGTVAFMTLERELVNRGDANWGIGVFLFNDGVLRNEGTWSAYQNQGTPGRMQGLEGGGVLINEGALVKLGDGEMRLARLGGDMALQNSGLVDVQEGSLRLLGADSTTNDGEYRMSHHGSIEVAGEFVNASAAALSFEVGAMKERGLSGLMTITGEATLAGTLAVFTPEPFSAAWGDRWTIMTFASREGDFDAFELPTEGFAARGDAYGASDLRWFAEAGDTEYVVGVSHIADIDHDGLIGFSDLNVIVSNYNAAGSWAMGDVDGDGFVGFADLNVVLSLYNVAAPRNVPGPGSVGMLAFGAAALGRRRR